MYAIGQIQVNTFLAFQIILYIVRPSPAVVRP